MTTTDLLKTNAKKFLQGTKKMLIDGEWVESASGKTFETLNPSNGEVLAHVYEGDAEDINRAVVAARKAFKQGPWGKMTASERSRLIYKLADLIEEHAEELAELETLDNGKPIKETMSADLPLTIEHFRYYAGWATKLTGETIPIAKQGHFNYTRYEPVGVVGLIVPWNYPLLLSTFKLGAALACGNTVILKPAEQTPLSILRLGELIIEAGFPEGVFNVVPGFGETAGAHLASHPMVDKVAFTGSTEVGKQIMQMASGNLKKVSLELGGKSPNIIFDDADLSQAVQGALSGAFFNQGEVCAAGSRLFVQRNVYEQVLSELIAQAEQIKLGDGLSPETEMGPLISKEQLERVSSYIEKGKEQGATLMTGGEYSSSGGYFVKPTIFTDVKDDMAIAKEEIFGPVVAVMPFDDVDEIIERANQSEFGLAAGVWTKDVNKAHNIAHALQSGTVWINCYNVLDAASPWGGYKQSGIGRDCGRYALDLYTEVKSVIVNLT